MRYWVREVCPKASIFFRQKLSKQRKSEVIYITLQPSEQKRNESRRLLQQISQVFVTPLPILGWGLSLRKTIFALLIIYVWTQEMSMNFCISFTLTTLWYEDLRICIFHSIFSTHLTSKTNKQRFCEDIGPEQHDGLYVWLDSKSKRHFQYNQDRTDCIRFCLNQRGTNRGQSNCLVALALATVDLHSLLLPLFLSSVPKIWSQVRIRRIYYIKVNKQKGERRESPWLSCDWPWRPRSWVCDCGFR